MRPIIYKDGIKAVRKIAQDELFGELLTGESTMTSQNDKSADPIPQVIRKTKMVEETEDVCPHCHATIHEKGLCLASENEMDKPFEEMQWVHRACGGVFTLPKTASMKRTAGLRKAADHDYNPEDDYELDEKPNSKVKNAVTKVLADINSVLPNYGMQGNAEVAYGSEDAMFDSLAVFANGTSSRPVIVVNAQGIIKGAKENNISIEEAVATTLWHEIGHAIQESAGLDFDEDDAENFAYHHYEGFGPDPFENLAKPKKKRGDKMVQEAFYDPNSTTNEGRKRLRDPHDFDQSTFRRWSKWAGETAPEGVQFLIGELLDGSKACQTIRFDKDVISEEEAEAYFKNIVNMKGFEKLWKDTEWVEQFPEYKPKKEYTKEKTAAKSAPYERGEFDYQGGVPEKTDGEAGYGIYAYPTNNSAMRDYYTQQGEDIVAIYPKEGTVVVDLTTKEAEDAIVAIAKEMMPNSKANRSNAHMQKWAILQYMQNKQADAYLVRHVGSGIPTGKQLIIVNDSAFDYDKKSSINSGKMVHEIFRKPPEKAEKQKGMLNADADFVKEADSTADADVLLEYPELRQGADFTCGPSALQSILGYYGTDIREDILAKQLKTDMEQGTAVADMIRVAKEFGLKTKPVKTVEEIKAAIDEAMPVIIVLQAWDDNPETNWEVTWEDGHFVTAIGYNDKEIIFEDPSSENRTYLTYEELDKRWHDLDADGSKLEHWGVAVYGKEPKYDSEEMVHMGTVLSTAAFNHVAEDRSVMRDRCEKAIKQYDRLLRQYNRTPTPELYHQLDKAKKERDRLVDQELRLD